MLPFMIVFANLPDNLEEFGIEVESSSPFDPKQKNNLQSRLLWTDYQASFLRGGFCVLDICNMKEWASTCAHG